jgi:hypothetical protein
LGLSDVVRVVGFLLAMVLLPLSLNSLVGFTTAVTPGQDSYLDAPNTSS